LAGHLLRKVRERVQNAVGAWIDGDRRAVAPEDHPLAVEDEKLAGNPALTSMYRRIVNKLALFRRHSLASARTLQTSHAEHRVVLEKLSAGNVAGVGEAMYNHVIASGERMQRAQEQFFNDTIPKNEDQAASAVPPRKARSRHPATAS
jgi:DNA-binding FadR family transcriptional regulator